MKLAFAGYPLGLKRARYISALAALLLATCTTVTYISDYGEGIDQGVTDLQKSWPDLQHVPARPLLLAARQYRKPGSRSRCPPSAGLSVQGSFLQTPLHSS